MGTETTCPHAYKIKEWLKNDEIKETSLTTVLLQIKKKWDYSNKVGYFLSVNSGNETCIFFLLKNGVKIEICLAFIYFSFIESAQYKLKT